MPQTPSNHVINTKDHPIIMNQQDPRGMPSSREPPRDRPNPARQTQAQFAESNGSPDDMKTYSYADYAARQRQKARKIMQGGQIDEWNAIREQQQARNDESDLSPDVINAVSAAEYAALQRQHGRKLMHDIRERQQAVAKWNATRERQQAGTRHEVNHQNTNLRTEAEGDIAILNLRPHMESETRGTIRQEHSPEHADASSIRRTPMSETAPKAPRTLRQPAVRSTLPSGFSNSLSGSEWTKQPLQYIPAQGLPSKAPRTKNNLNGEQDFAIIRTYATEASPSKDPRMIDADGKEGVGIARTLATQARPSKVPLAKKVEDYKDNLANARTPAARARSSEGPRAKNKKIDEEDVVITRTSATQALPNKRIRVKTEVPGPSSRTPVRMVAMGGPSISSTRITPISETSDIEVKDYKPKGKSPKAGKFTFEDLAAFFQGDSPYINAETRRMWEELSSTLKQQEDWKRSQETPASRGSESPKYTLEDLATFFQEDLAYIDADTRRSWEELLRTLNDYRDLYRWPLLPAPQGSVKKPITPDVHEPLTLNAAMTRKVISENDRKQRATIGLKTEAMGDGLVEKAIEEAEVLMKEVTAATREAETAAKRAFQAQKDAKRTAVKVKADALAEARLVSMMAQEEAALVEAAKTEGNALAGLNENSKTSNRVTKPLFEKDSIQGKQLAEFNKQFQRNLNKQAFETATEAAVTNTDDAKSIPPTSKSKMQQSQKKASTTEQSKSNTAIDEHDSDEKKPSAEEVFYAEQKRKKKEAEMNKNMADIKAIMKEKSAFADENAKAKAKEEPSRAAAKLASIEAEIGANRAAGEEATRTEKEKAQKEFVPYAHITSPDPFVSAIAEAVSWEPVSEPKIQPSKNESPKTEQPKTDTAAKSETSSGKDSARDSQSSMKSVYLTPGTLSFLKSATPSIKSASVESITSHENKEDEKEDDWIMLGNAQGSQEELQAGDMEVISRPHLGQEDYNGTTRSWFMPWRR